MLSKMIVNMYARFLEISLWISLIIFVGGGFMTPGETGGIVGGLIGFLVWVVFSTVFLGFFLAVDDIRKAVREIAAHKATRPLP